MVKVMNIASLKRELAKRGLRVSGNKAPLKRRLLAAITAHRQSMEQEQPIQPKPEQYPAIVTHQQE